MACVLATQTGIPLQTVQHAKTVHMEQTARFIKLIKCFLFEPFLLISQTDSLFWWIRKFTMQLAWTGKNDLRVIVGFQCFKNCCFHFD
jgi:hypothetical protein